MTVLDDELNRDFVVVDARMTGRQAMEAAKDKAYLVIKFADGRYAAVAEPRRKLQPILNMWKIQDVPLGDVPKDTFDKVFARWMVGTVKRDLSGPEDSERVENLKSGELLIVLENDEVVGLLVEKPRRSAGRPLARMEEPSARPPDVGTEPAPPAPKGMPGTLTVEDAPSEPEKRFINAEIRDHDPSQPLQVGQEYELAFDVDIEVRASAVGGAALGQIFAAGEELVELTVQLSSDDFIIHTQEPQKLRVPRSGKSKNKARFDIEPRHQGEGLINAVFLKDGNFIQLVTLKLRVGVPVQTGVLTAEQSLGRPVAAAFELQPRDLNLTILNTGTGFQVIMAGAVGALATLPLTLAQLDQMITQVRQELKDIVYLEVGSPKTRIYQSKIDIPPEVNRAALKRLAAIGFRLYQQIFYGPAADAQANLLGDRLRQMAQQERLKIQIFSQQFMLPWGILYMADDYDPDQVDPELFLGLKHIIEHIPLQPNMQVIRQSVEHQPQLTVSLNVNTDIDQQMGVPLIANQQSDWQQIVQSSGDQVQVIVRKTKDEVMQALASGSTPDHILYFYCHAVSKSLAEGGGPDASTLVLSGNGRLTLGDLSVFAPAKKVLPGQPLVFINACESAELSPLFYDGFVPYFMSKGARGIIGTECETPALFATEWAKRFFKQFLDGKLLGQAFLDLRREFFYQHNNLMGLLYALYSDGDTQITPELKV